MMTNKSYVIIYLWRGERHRYGNIMTMAKVREELACFVRAKFQAWIEQN